VLVGKKVEIVVCPKCKTEYKSKVAKGRPTRPCPECKKDD